MAARRQSLVHGLDDGAARVEVGARARAALTQLVIIDLKKSHDELVEVRDDQAQLLVQGAGVSRTHSSPLLVLCKALQSQKQRDP